MRRFHVTILALLFTAIDLCGQSPNNLCGADCDLGGFHCSDYNSAYPLTTYPELSDNKYHITLDHSADWAVDQSCNYVQNGSQLPDGMWPCVTDATTSVQLLIAADYGTIQLQNDGFEHLVTSGQVWTSTGRGSTSSTYGVVAIAVNGCYSSDTGCEPINIQWNGLSPNYPLHEGNDGYIIYTDSALTDTLNCPFLTSDYYSPIVIDLETKNFEDAFTSVEDGVTWDFVGKGHLQRLAWTNPNRNIGFLVLDRNHNGRIDNATEMFGNLTLQPLNEQEWQLAREQAARNQPWHPNGFLALEFFDRKKNGGNENGKIDAGDAIFSELRVWVDTAHDANSRDGKLYTLAELGIKSISLAYSESPRTDRYGNKLRYQGTIEMEKVGAAIPQIYDVFFRSGKQ